MGAELIGQSEIKEPETSLVFMQPHWPSSDIIIVGESRETSTLPPGAQNISIEPIPSILLNCIHHVCWSKYAESDTRTDFLFSSSRR
jgi:hypothetical protein